MTNDERWLTTNNIPFIRKSFIPDKPVIVCLCGSTRFKEQYERVMRDQTLAGRIVLSVGLFTHANNLNITNDVKAFLDNLHLRKIDLADEIFVIDPDGYIGDSTRKEIEYAKGLGKPVNYYSSFYEDDET